MRVYSLSRSDKSWGEGGRGMNQSRASYVGRGAFFVVFLVLMAFLLVLSGCSQQSNKSVDEQFMTALSTGLENRWKITDAADGQSQESLEKAIQAEKDAIGAFYDQEFENAELGEAAKRYIDTLNASNAADMYSANNYSRWAKVYNSRVAALYDINDIQSIPVSDSKKSTLNELLNDGEAASFALASIPTVTFEPQPSEYEGSKWIEYKAVVENTSNLSFSYFNYNVNVTDSDGVVTDTYIASTNDWTPGTKHTFEFSTDANVASIDVTSCEWSL